MSGGRTGAFAPTEAQQEVQWAGDRKGRPYGSVTRSAVGRADVTIGPYEWVCAPGKKQNRPRLLPRTMRCTVVPPCFAACSRRRPYEVPLHFRAVTGAPVRA